MLEKDIQRQILDYLKMKNIFCYKSNNVGIYKKSTGRYIPSQVLGLPDIIAVKNGIYFGIEVKCGNGKQSDNQCAFQDNLKKAGGVYILAYDLSDVIVYFK